MRLTSDMPIVRQFTCIVDLPDQERIGLAREHNFEFMIHCVNGFDDPFRPDVGECYFDVVIWLANKICDLAFLFAVFFIVVEVEIRRCAVYFGKTTDDRLGRKYWCR